ncbi:hypothetical protein K438DRAFT_1937908 [Mycena galopus ATCC 62051]|nr:hypothetical protein K438DRAFT_1937908 [Mycena galopus ATCC 62051]
MPTLPKITQKPSYQEYHCNFRGAVLDQLLPQAFAEIGTGVDSTLWTRMRTGTWARWSSCGRWSCSAMTVLLGWMEEPPPSMKCHLGSQTLGRTQPDALTGDKLRTVHLSSTFLRNANGHAEFLIDDEPEPIRVAPRRHIFFLVATMGKLHSRPNASAANHICAAPTEYWTISFSFILLILRKHNWRAGRRLSPHTYHLGHYNTIHLLTPRLNSAPYTFLLI